MRFRTQPKSQPIPEWPNPQPHTEAELGYVRPNKCGVGAHFAGEYEYRVIALEHLHDEDQWTTKLYTEFLDKALDCFENIRADGGVAHLQSASWVTLE